MCCPTWSGKQVGLHQDGLKNSDSGFLKKWCTCRISARRTERTLSQKSMAAFVPPAKPLANMSFPFFGKVESHRCPFPAFWILQDWKGLLSSWSDSSPFQVNKDKQWAEMFQSCSIESSNGLVLIIGPHLIFRCTLIKVDCDLSVNGNTDLWDPEPWLHSCLSGYSHPGYTATSRLTTPGQIQMSFLEDYLLFLFSVFVYTSIHYKNNLRTSRRGCFKIFSAFRTKHGACGCRVCSFCTHESVFGGHSYRRCTNCQTLTGTPFSQHRTGSLRTQKEKRLDPPLHNRPNCLDTFALKFCGQV